MKDNTPTPVTPLLQDEEVTILPPDYTLKKAIGNVEMSKMLDEAVVAQAQQNVDSKQEDFLQWIGEDIAKLERAFTDLTVKLKPGNLHLEELRRIAISIKSQAGTFGFTLASSVARSLYTFCDNFGFTEAQALVLRKHIDAIKLILQKRITGDGGPVGQELLKDMAKLVSKFR